ncbi:alpha/beta fold hydrolase [Bradyrhizobium erythrophlei]|uniref:alpha/beta fold hydrolase n=1 Tax=Bradyrhizobium erythrophlei TaxID=1437360 RepID=UPI0030B85EAC
MEITTRSKTQPKGINRVTYVLIHGGWHGSWCWKRIRKALQGAGHEVFTPSLTGVGERSHLSSATVIRRHLL